MAWMKKEGEEGISRERGAERGRKRGIKLAGFVMNATVHIPYMLRDDSLDLNNSTT